MIFDHRNRHFLQADTAMHKIQPATIHLDANTFPWSKSSVFRFSVQEFYRKQILRIRLLLHDCIASAIFHFHIMEAGFIHFVILGQRTVSVQEAMICRNQNVRPAEVIDDNAHHILQFTDSPIACREHRGVRCMACFVNGIMVDIDYIHPLDQCRTLCTFHPDDVLILQRHAGRIYTFQDLIPVRACGRLPIGQNIQYLIFQFSRQRFVWEQCRHAKFRDRREDALHTAEFHIALRFSAQFICQ